MYGNECTCCLLGTLKEAKQPDCSSGYYIRNGRGGIPDPNQVVLENYFFQDEHEQRLQIIGVTQNLVLLLVVYAERLENEDEIIHIISARKANKYERKIYETAASKT